MILTLSDKKLEQSIPTYECSNGEEVRELIHHWLEVKNYDESVFVCFRNWRGLPIKDLRNEQNSVLVSHDEGDILLLVEFWIDEIEFGFTELDYDVDIAIFEFGSYQDAFMYCIDLKESF